VCESVLPATTFTWLCTNAFGAGVQTVTDGLTWLSGQGEAAKAGLLSAAMQITLNGTTLWNPENMEQLRTEVIQERRVFLPASCPF
jgi:hypothetical protein